MSWFKHENDVPVDIGYRREVSQGSNAGGSFFTDPQSYNENSRALKNRAAMKAEFKNDYLAQQNITDKKREEKFESKRFSTDKYLEQQANERRDLEEKQDEKLRKLEKQKFYQAQLQQQMQDNFDRKQAQRARENEDSTKHRSPFNSGLPQYQRDITNQEQLEALEVEKRNRKEKQDLYARQLSAQLEEQQEKKMYEKYQRRQPNPTSADGDSLERLKRERDQMKRNYADALQDHINVQSNIKQQQREKERSDQQLTGLDIQGSYKFNGPSKQQLREELASQIQQKEYAKMKESERNPYQRNAPVDYSYIPDTRSQENPYAGGYQDPTGGYQDPSGGYSEPTRSYHQPSGGYQDPYQDQQEQQYYQKAMPITGKSNAQKENIAALDIFGNPARQHTKPVRQGGDFDIFGNPTKRR